MKLIYFIFAITFSSLWITGCSNGVNEIDKKVEENSNEFPPSMRGIITVNETEYEMVSGNFRWVKKQGLETEVVQTDAVSPYQIAENFSAIKLEKNTDIRVNIEENPNISVYLWNENGREKEVYSIANQFSVPSSEGQYIYEVLAKWGNGEVSYTFVVKVE